MKMFNYIGDLKEINKIRNQLTFTELYQLSEELDRNLLTGISFEQFIFNKFGDDYFKKPEIIAISLELLTLYN